MVFNLAIQRGTAFPICQFCVCIPVVSLVLLEQRVEHRRSASSELISSPAIWAQWHGLPQPGLEESR